MKSRCHHRNIHRIGFLLALSCLLFAVSRVSAQTATPDASPTTDPAIKEKVEERIQKVLNEKTENKRAFAGEIRVINSTIEIKTKTETKHLLLSETDLTIVGVKKEALEVQDLEIGDFVIAMGFLAENGTLDTRRIVIASKPKEDTRRVLFGKITDLTNDGENILTVKAFSGDKEQVFEIETTAKTGFFRKEKLDSEEIDFSDLAADSRVVIIGTPNAKNDKLISAQKIYLLPETPADSENEKPNDQEKETESKISPAPSPKTTPSS